MGLTYANTYANAYANAYAPTYANACVQSFAKLLVTAG